MEQALSNYDILSNIILRVDPKSLANCVYVCKPWSDIALDVRWRAISNIGQATVLLRMANLGLAHGNEADGLGIIDESGKDGDDESAGNQVR
jgi:hypothetical protein